MCMNVVSLCIYWYYMCACVLRGQKMLSHFLKFEFGMNVHNDKEKQVLQTVEPSLQALLLHIIAD